jgi:hypothetical protein
MALQIIEEYFPKTAKYINDVYDKEGKDRCGHHNYVIEQRICNFSYNYGMTVDECEKAGRIDILQTADTDFVEYLRYIDKES